MKTGEVLIKERSVVGVARRWGVRTCLLGCEGVYYVVWWGLHAGGGCAIATAAIDQVTYQVTYNDSISISLRRQVLGRRSFAVFLFFSPPPPTIVLFTVAGESEIRYALQERQAFYYYYEFRIIPYYYLFKSRTLDAKSRVSGQEAPRFQKLPELLLLCCSRLEVDCW